MHPHTQSDMDPQSMMQDTAFSIENVQEILETEQQRERVEVPPGEYVAQIQLPLPEPRQDSKGHNKILLPLEIVGGEYESSWLFEAIYMNNQHDQAGKTKDAISKRKVARLASAVGLKAMKDFEDIAGKFVTVDYGPNKNGYNEIRSVSSFSTNQAPTGASPVTDKEKDGLPF